ncbi:MAG: hypothetical protein O9296_17530, partial [Novosphingobium sp.]|nr:hypothetical protein [Novosphingobium sp.]
AAFDADAPLRERRRGWVKRRLQLLVRCVTPAGPLRTASGSHTDPALAERCAWNSTDAISLGTDGLRVSATASASRNDSTVLDAFPRKRP